MIFTWWCAVTVVRWWSRKPLRNTARGVTVSSRRCVVSHQPWLRSSGLALASLLSSFPSLGKGRGTVHMVKIELHLLHRYLSTSTGPLRPRGRLWGTVYGYSPHDITRSKKFDHSQDAVFVWSGFYKGVRVRECDKSFRYSFPSAVELLSIKLYNRAYILFIIISNIIFIYSILNLFIYYFI